MIKLVIDEGNSYCMRLVDAIRQQPKVWADSVTIVSSREDEYFVKQEKITTFPVLYSDYSNVKHIGSQNVYNYLRGYFGNNEFKVEQETA